MAGLPGKTVALGNPQSSIHQISQVQLADWMTEIEGLTGLSGFAFVRGSVAALSGLGTDGNYALVVTTATERGIYQRASGSWSKVADLPLILSESLAADQAEADRILAQAAAVSAGNDADAAAASATAAASSQSLADVARTQAQLAAVAAGATLYASVAAGEADTVNGDVFLVSTDPGVQVYENDTGTGAFLGWLGEVLLDDVTAVNAWTPPAYPQTGLILRTRKEGFAYSVMASGASAADLTTAGGVKLRVLPDAQGRYSVASLSSDPATAFAALFPGHWVVAENMTLAADTTVELDDFILETAESARITINGGAGFLAIRGTRSGVGNINVYGRLVIGGSGSTDRKTDCRAGKIRVESNTTAPALSFAWCSNLIVSEPFDVLLSGSAEGNIGVSYTILKNPWIAGGAVRGNVSLGYQYVGNSTVAEPTIDGGYIGPQYTIKADAYAGVSSGHHGHYRKGCRGVTFGMTEVFGGGANAWGSTEYHIKLRDNEGCAMNGIRAVDPSASFRLGRIFVTSDANTLAQTENENNTFKDIFGKVVVFQTSPGVTQNNEFHNVYGQITQTIPTQGNFISGSVTFPDTSLTEVNNRYEFRNAIVDIPAMGTDGQFVRTLVAKMTIFKQGFEVFGSAFTLIGCFVDGTIRHDSDTGTFVLGVYNCRVTGTLSVNSFPSRQQTADVKNTSFGGNETVSPDVPSVKNYANVTFANAAY